MALLIFFFQILLHILLLPVKLVVQIVCYLGWRPNWIVGDVYYLNFKQNHADLMTWSEDNIDMWLYAEDGDGAKFTGMYCALDKTSAVHALTRYISMDGKLFRYPRSTDRNTYNGATFSGDMMSGFNYGVQANAIHLAAYSRVLEMYRNIFLRGIPCKIAHPFRGEWTGRGWLWRFFDLAPATMHTMAALRTAIQIEPLLEYKIMYWTLVVTYMPLLWLGDLNILCGKVYASKWYTPHSIMLSMCAGYEATKHPWFKWGAKSLYNRYGEINLDIHVLYSYHFNDKKLMNWMRVSTMVHDMLKSKKGSEECPIPLKKVYDILRFNTRMIAPNVLPRRYRGGDYIWEKSPVTPQLCSHQEQVSECLDVWFPIHLLAEMME